MKVFSVPDEVKWVEPDFANYDFEKEQAREALHQAELARWLKEHGCSGPHTGEIISFPAGDGAAQYMLADGPKSFLVHLPYGDAWHSETAKYMSKKDVIARIKGDKAFQKTWDDMKAKQTPPINESPNWRGGTSAE